MGLNHNLMLNFCSLCNKETEKPLTESYIYQGKPLLPSEVAIFQKFLEYESLCILCHKCNVLCFLKTPDPTATVVGHCKQCKGPHSLNCQISEATSHAFTFSRYTRLKPSKAAICPLHFEPPRKVVEVKKPVKKVKLTTIKKV
jgi:hypothetical protein